MFTNSHVPDIIVRNDQKLRNGTHIMHQFYIASLSSLSENFSSVMSRGGPVMWPLLLCSAAALAVVAERAFVFAMCAYRDAKAGDKLEEVFELTARGDFAAAVKLAETAGPMGEVIAEAAAKAESGINDALESAGNDFIANLRRHMPLLDTVITLSPMLGILGTVTGIIGSFNLLDLTGTSDPAAISGGIAEALITTAAGLAIAIAVLVPFNYFRAKLSDWASKTDRTARRFAAAYMKGTGNAD